MNAGSENDGNRQRAGSEQHGQFEPAEHRPPLAPPAEQRADPDQHRKYQCQRSRNRVEVRCADRQFLPAHGLDEQGVECTHEDDAEDHAQNQVVDDEARLAAHDLERRPFLEGRSAEREQSEGRPHVNREQRE